MSYIEIKEELLKLQDKKYGEFNSKLCPDTHKKMIGIRIPKLREFSQRIIKEENWEQILEILDQEYFEETILKGFLIAYAPKNVEEKIKHIKQFVTEIDSWAITDSFVPSLKIKKKELEIFWNFILPYMKSEKEFEVRFAVIVMLDYYLIDQYIDKVIATLDGIEHDGYYVKMAKAWILAEIGIKFPEKGMTYLKSKNHLDKFTYNKTLQKMIESYRIDSEQKDILRKMKQR